VRYQLLLKANGKIRRKTSLKQTPKQPADGSKNCLHKVEQRRKVPVNIDSFE
jgi:hypothetical protein